MISDKIKALLKMRGKGNAELAEGLGISTQALSNKLYRGSFSASDLIRVANCLDCELAFILNDKQKITLDAADIAEKRTADTASQA